MRDGVEVLAKGGGTTKESRGWPLARNGQWWVQERRVPPADTTAYVKTQRQERAYNILGEGAQSGRGRRHTTMFRLGAGVGVQEPSCPGSFMTR